MRCSCYLIGDNAYAPAVAVQCVHRRGRAVNQLHIIRLQHAWGAYIFVDNTCVGV